MTAKDVHNLIYRARQERHATEGSVHDRVRARLEEFVEEPGNLFKVFTGDDSVASCITMQTAAMRKYYAVFPEILIVDSTHGEITECATTIPCSHPMP